MSQETTLKYPFPAVSVCHPLSWKWPALVNIWHTFDKIPLIGMPVNENWLIRLIEKGTFEMARLNYGKDMFPLEPKQSIIGYIENHFHGDSVAMESALWLHFLTFHFAGNLWQYGQMKKAPYSYLLKLKTLFCKEICPGDYKRGKIDID